MNLKTPMMATALLLALFVLVPAPAQADPIGDALTTVKQTQSLVAETAEAAIDSLEEPMFTIERQQDCGLRQPCSGDDEHPPGSPGECNENPNNIECVCARYPSSPTCTGERKFCDNGQQGWDTDGDGICNADDYDDDGDGVPDSCDPSPRSPNPVDNAYSTVVWMMAGSPPRC